MFTLSFKWVLFEIKTARSNSLVLIKLKNPYQFIITNPQRKMVDREFETYQNFHQGTQKFDYFICGLASALFAYLSQTYKPQPIEWGPALITPLALILLAASVFTGLLKIEQILKLTGANSKLLLFQKNISDLRNAIANRRDGYFTFPTGHIVGPQDYEKALEIIKENEQEIKDNMSEDIEISLKWYRIRNLCLGLGFTAVILGKILEPYQ